MNNQEEFKETELGLLPNEWDIKKIEDIVEIFDKKRVPLNSDVRAKRQGIYPYCGANGIIDYIDDYIFDGEFVLLAEDGGYWGVGENSSYLMNRKFWVNNHAHIIKAIPQVANNYFLSYVLNYIDMNPLIGGDARGKLTQMLMRTIKIPFPSLSEQERIAFVLSTVQYAKERTQNLINSLRELKKSTMKHLFTYGAVGFNNISNVELKETEIGMIIPKNWDEEKLVSYIEFSKKPRELKFSGSEDVVFIPMEKISDNDKPVNFEIKKYKDIASWTFVAKNDLILSKITPCFENGKQAILKNIPSEYAFATTEVIPFHPKDNEINLSYIYYLLKYSKIRNYLISKMQGTTGRKRLSKEALENLIIPKPNFSEQQQISNTLSSIDEKIEVEERRVSALEQLFKSLLHNLMRGKIRVKDLKLPEVKNG